MTGKAAKAAETCPEFARKSAALFNPRARIAWNAAGKSVVVVGTLDPAKTIGLVCAGHVAGELPGATKHLHSDGGATTFEVHAATRPADAIDALFETFPEIRCVSATQLDPPAIKIPKIPKIPKTVFARCESLCLPEGLANAEAYATATKTIEAMTAAIAALTADYESRPPADGPHAMCYMIKQTRPTHESTTLRRGRGRQSRRRGRNRIPRSRREIATCT